MRLIDVDNAISHYKALSNIEWNQRVSPCSWADAYDEFSEYLEEAPTVDAVEVVQCKDFGYWKYIEDVYGECSHPRFHLDGHPDPTMEMNGFCSCGERRNDDGE